MNFLFTKQGFQLQLNRFPYQPDALNGVWVTHLSTFLQVATKTSGKTQILLHWHAQNSAC